MEFASSCQEGNYGELKSDPLTLLSLIDKYVKVHLIKNLSFTGFIHSIDSLTYSILISVPHEEAYQTTLIPGHAILDITEITPHEDVIPPLKKLNNELTNDDVLVKKQKLIGWFKSNLLPVTEIDNTIVFGNVSVLPPYNVTDICSDNPIVALQIRKIIEKMPQDFEPK